MSSSVTVSRPATARLTSSCAFRITLGFVMSSAMIHCSAVDAVPLPPENMSCTTTRNQILTLISEEKLHDFVCLFFWDSST
jgi:hypothetical protein